MNPCPYCGIEMANSRRVQCGGVHCKRRYNRERGRAYLTHRKDVDGVRYEDRYKVESTCPDCGKPFMTRGYERCRPCSHRRNLSMGLSASISVRSALAEQRRAARTQLVPAGPLRANETLRWRMAAQKLKVAAAGSRSKRAVWVGASCRGCDEPFICMWTNDLPQWCSRRCLRRASKARRRQRGGQAVPYRRIDIFERDRWVCRLCGKKTRRRAQAPEAKAPVIDHIIPLAAGAENGGVDAPWNVQCAHWLCNSIKSAKYTSPALF